MIEIIWFVVLVALFGIVSMVTKARRR